MEYQIKTNGHEQDWKYIREEVFMKEQGFENEFDEIDAIAEHICLYVNGTVIGCGRLFSTEENTYTVGRVALVKEYRKGGYGSIILEELEKIARQKNAKKLVLSAQCRVKAFYEKNGYVAQGEGYMDEHVPHIHMEKVL